MLQLLRSQRGCCIDNTYDNNKNNNKSPNVSRPRWEQCRCYFGKAPWHYSVVTIGFWLLVVLSLLPSSFLSSPLLLDNGWVANGFAEASGVPSALSMTSRSSNLTVITRQSQTSRMRRRRSSRLLAAFVPPTAAVVGDSRNHSYQQRQGHIEEQQQNSGRNSFTRKTLIGPFRSVRFLKKQQPSPSRQILAPSLLVDDDNNDDNPTNGKKHHLHGSGTAVTTWNRRREPNRRSTTTTTTGLYSKTIDNNDDETMAKKSSRRGWIMAIGVILLLVTVEAAKLNILPPPLFDVIRGESSLTTFSMEVVPYTNAYLWCDVGWTILTTILGYILAKSIALGYEMGFLSSKDSRKLIHTLSAPLFMLFWPMFSPAQGSQVFCSLVALLNIVRLYFASTGQGESRLAMAVSRSGNLKEALGGPFVYVCILFVAIVTFWRTSSAGIVALCALAVGDGLADLIGRRYGQGNVWPFLPPTQKKSVAGSIAFWIGTTLSIVGLLQWFQQFPGCGPHLALTVDGGNLLVTQLWIRAVVIGFVTAALALVPVVDDNYTVPLAGAMLALFLFPTV